ncbi:MAG: Rieske (2Fe-2S) protein [Gemmatimonadaceae bacterium]
MRIPLSSIPDPGMLPVKLPDGDRIVLIRRGNVVTALEDECPHQAMPLSAGELLPDGSVECPWHGARFDCATGACLRGPATDPVPTYAVSVDGDQITIGARQSARA